MRLDEIFGPKVTQLPWVNSPEFKTWFGKSKVVDDKGNPRVVFHGTFEDFKTFKLESEKRRAHGFNRLGFWFDVHPETPNYFAGYTPMQQVTGEFSYSAGSVVMAFLSIQKPLIFSSEQLYIDDRKMLNRHLRLGNLKDFNKEIEKLDRQDSFDRLFNYIAQTYRADILSKHPYETNYENNLPIDEYLRKKAIRSDEIIEKFKQECIAEGYDGILLQETLADSSSRQGSIETDWWIAFYPNQIKAAIGNRGTFSKDSEDITESEMVNKTEMISQPEKAKIIENPKFRKWFGQSKVVDAQGNPLVVYHGGRKGIKVFGENYKETLEWAATTGFKLSEIERLTYENPVHFFTDEPYIAADYADQFERENKETYEVYLRIERPIDLRPDITGKDEVSRLLTALLQSPFEFNSEATRRDMNFAVSHTVRGLHHLLKGRSIAMGHDGIIMPDTCVRDRSLHTSYVVFDSNQIKAAIGNRGTFSKDSEDITERAKIKLSTSGDNIGAWVHDGFPWQGKPEKTVILPINKIDVNEPDSKFDDAENAANLKSIQKALKKGQTLPPILVRRVGMRFQIMDGHHRFKAYKSLGMKNIPVRIIHPRNITEE